MQNYTPHELFYRDSIKLFPILPSKAQLFQARAFLQLQYYRALFVIFLFLSGAFFSVAQPCYPVADVYRDSSNQSAIVYMSEFTAVGNQVFFSGGECEQSPELYVLDAETGTIRMVANNWDYDSDAYKFCNVDALFYFASPRYLTAAKDGRLFFTCPDNDFGGELWVTDGTAMGTYPVKDIAPGKSSSYPKYLVPLKDGVLFTAEDPQLGLSLWYSDGTEAGTVLVKDMEAGASATNVFNLIPADSIVFFLASINDGTQWLWRTNSTVNGTFPIEQIAYGGIPGNFVFAGTKLYYYSQLGDIWVTDGTPGAAIKLHAGENTPFGLSVGGFTEFQGKVYFANYSSGSGSELWQTDGTPAGTVLLKDLFPGTESSNPGGFTPLGNRLLFQARDQDQKVKTWTTDGTATGTTPLNDFANSGDIYTNGKIACFLGTSPAHNYRALWQTDGTPAGTSYWGGIFKRVQHAFPLKDWLVLYAYGPDEIYRWWRVDWNTKTIMPFKAVFSNNGSGIDPWTYMQYTAIGNQVIYIGLDDHSYQVFRAEKDKPGAVPLTSFKIPQYYPAPHSLVSTGERAYFKIYKGNYEHEIWATDGSPTGTGPVLSYFYKGVTNSSISLIGASNQNIVFWGDSAILWQYMPLSDSLVFLKRFAWTGSLPSVRLNDKYFFWAAEALDTGEELWATDGTPQGTYLVKDINPGPESSGTSALALEGQHVFFRANDGKSGREPWRTDGTENGTLLLADINLNGPSNPQGFTGLADRVYFWATDSLQDTNIWVTDGTPAGTKLFVDLPPKATDYVGFPIIAYFDKLIFTYHDSLHGKELWISDGTPAGTQLLLDIVPGVRSSQPDNFIVFDSLLFFTAFTPELGRELWQTDGSPQGTKPVQDILPGPGSSTPGGLAVYANRLYFSAYAPELGRELWVYRPPDETSSTGPLPPYSSIDFRLFPNPVQMEHSIGIQQLNNTTHLRQAKLINPDGRVIREWTLDPALEYQSLDLSGLNLSSGLYLVALTGQSGVLLAVLKCVLVE